MRCERGREGESEIGGKGGLMGVERGRGREVKIGAIGQSRVVTQWAAMR